jgi:putative transposase
MPPTTFIRTTGEFGHRFIADELHAAGLQTSERRVWRLCSQQELFSHTIKRARKHGKKPGPPVCDDLVERDFTAKAINELWLTDVTEHHTGEGKLYMCAVKDVFSNRIVGYAIDSRMKLDRPGCGGGLDPTERIGTCPHRVSTL